MIAPVTMSSIDTQSRRARRAVFLAFFLNGFVIAMWVVNVPTVASAAGVSNAVLGTTLLALGAGSVVAMQAAGLLAARFGSRPVVAAGSVALAAGSVAIGLADDAVMLAAALFLLGLGNGGIDVAMNDQAVVVQRRYGRPIMSAFHALFSVGGAASAGLGALAQQSDISYRTALQATAVVALVLGAIATAGLLPACRSGHDPAAADTDVTSRGPVNRLRLAVLLGALAFVFMLAEGMVNDWSALHARQHLDVAASAASLAYLFFAVTMTLGRFAVDRVVAAVGPVTVVRYGSMLAVAGLIVVIVSPVYPLTIAGWVLFGIGLAGTVPQIFTAAGSLASGPRGAIMLSRVVSAGYVGMLAGPAVIGWISAGVGIDLAFLVPLALIILGVAGAKAVAPDQPPTGTIEHDPLAEARAAG